MTRIESIDNFTELVRICRLCGRDFVSDQTPMARDGVCMPCRPLIEVVCVRCHVACPGASDGQKWCSDCRAVPLGVQQYEDKQQALLERLRATGAIP